MTSTALLVLFVFLFAGFAHELSSGEVFSFTLNELSDNNIKQNEAKTFKEPGWNIHDSRNRDLVVQVDIPPKMRQGIVGQYDISYFVHLKHDLQGTPVATAIRKVNVVPVDQCKLGLDDCSKYADCITEPTAEGYRCVCKKGFRGDGRSCFNINECEEPNDCSKFAICRDTHGSYVCTCKPGFTGNGTYCEDIDECATGQHNCDRNAICTNTLGSFTCKCEEGYEGNGVICVPINQCTREHQCDPNATCRPDARESRGYICICNAGWQGDGFTCKDIDECQDPHRYCPPHSNCINTEGSYECRCNPGFRETYRDGKMTCEDIDECALQYDDCGANSLCINTVGSYECRCKPGFQGTDGRNCVPVMGSRFILSGENPMRIPQFSEYSEPGLLFDDQSTRVSIFVEIPSALEGIARECGIFVIQYTVIGREQSEFREHKNRTVHVEEQNQCILPESSPFRHNCNVHADCRFLPGQCNYTCICRPGYGGPGYGPEGCIDNVPPIIPSEKDRYFLRECHVCGEVRARTVLENYILTYAYDERDQKIVDVSNTIQLTISDSDEENCVIHTYTAHDEVGNIAQKQITVCKEIIDIRTTIIEMQNLYNWQIFIIRAVGYLAFIAILMLIVWESGYRLAAFCRVFFFTPSGSSPVYKDFDIAYSIWYRLLNPFASESKIREMVLQRWALYGDGDEEEEEYDDEEDYSDDDD